MENTLSHWGIKGMKWGVRRYQNKDGSLTPEGKKRYDDSNDNVHDDYKKAHAKGSVKRMSTADLRERNQRLEEEKKYANLIPKEKGRLEKTKDTVDELSSLNRELSKIEKTIPTKPKAQNIDLSSISDKEMRDYVNRKMLEKQYLAAIGSEETVSRGRERARTILEGAGTVLTIGGSALSLAIAIKELTK